MKPIYSYALLAALAAVSPALAVDATTTPVGYITHTVAGAGSSAGAETYIAPTLITPSVFAGSSTVSPSGGATITFTGGVPTGLDGTYVLEITSATGEGWWSTVASSTATSVTVSDNFPASLPASVSVRVRKHATITTFLGFNNPGLVPFDGENPNDEVQVFDPVTQAAVPYAFVPAAVWGDLDNYPNGVWLDVANSLPANDTIIEPGTSIRIRRVGVANLTFTSSGEVKTTKTQVDIYQGFNFVGATQAAGGTLGNSGVAPFLYQYTGEGPNYDEIQKVLLDQSTVPFGVVDDGGPAIWDIANGAVVNSEPFDAGTGVVISRVGNPTGTITLNGSTVAP